MPTPSKDLRDGVGFVFVFQQTEIAQADTPKKETPD
jgi:hypothetical protein